MSLLHRTSCRHSMADNYRFLQEEYNLGSTTFDIHRTTISLDKNNMVVNPLAQGQYRFQGEGPD